MTIDEAINLISEHVYREDFYLLKPESRAFVLAREALKEVKLRRSIAVGFVTPLLPGETED